MENTVAVQKPAFAKSITPYGVIFGIIMIVELVVMYILKPDPLENGWVGTTTNVLNYFVFTTLFIALACNNFKKSNGGYITFGQCLRIGVGVCALAAFLYAVFYFIFCLIFPEFLPELMEQMKRVAVHSNPNITSEQLKMSMDIMESTMKPYFTGPLTIAIYSFVGLIISLIVGAVIKKENPYGDFTPPSVDNIGAE
jgi:multidrug efflux pump subunit AcrB